MIDRAKYDPFTHPQMKDGKDLFHGFMPFLDKLSPSDGVENNSMNQHHALRNSVSALKFIRLILWQDLGVLYRTHPHLQLFKCSLIQQNLDIFKRWVDIVNGCGDVLLEKSGCFSGKANEECNSSHHELSEQIQQLSRQQELTSMKIDLLLAKQPSSANQVTCMNSKLPTGKDRVPINTMEPSFKILNSLQKMDDKSLIPSFLF